MISQKMKNDLITFKQHAEEGTGTGDVLARFIRNMQDHIEQVEEMERGGQVKGSNVVGFTRRPLRTGRQPRGDHSFDA